MHLECLQGVSFHALFGCKGIFAVNEQRWWLPKRGSEVPKASERLQ